MVTLVGVSRLTLLLALSLCIILVNASSDCADSFTCQGGETCTQNSQCGGSNSYCQTICVCDTTRGGIFCSNPAPKITSVTRPPTTGGPLSIIGSGFQKNTSSIADLHISGSINVRTKSYGGSGTSTTGLSTTTGGSGFGKRSIYDAVLHYTREASILALDVVMKTYITPGVTSCTVTQFTDSLIVCTMPAGTGKLVMILDIIVDEDVIRVPFDASYNDAAIQQQVTISKITTAPTTGGRVTIYGTNFGTDKNNLLNSFFPSPDPQEPAILMNYDSYEILSSTMMTLTVTPGVGTHKFIQSVGASRVATTLNYTAPVVYYVEGVPALGASTKVAGAPVTIKGKYFGQSGNQNYVRVTVAGMECTNPQVVDDETIKCGLPLGCGKQNPVVVSVGNTAANSQSSNQNVTISYAEATIITVPDQIDIKGQTTFITIQGDNFCDTSLTTQTPARKRTIFPSGWTGTFTIFVGQTECTIVVSTTTTIVCSISSSAGTGSNNKIYINLNSGLNFGSYIQLPTVVTFPFPYVSDVAPFRNVPQSGSKITISGTGFGNADDVFLTNKRHVTVGGVNCPISSLTSTEIVCSPLGKGFNSPVVVTINGQHSNNNHFVDFANYQFANKFCNEPYGAPDKNTPEYCNCFSGFAPAVGDLQFASCPTKASCPGKIMSNLDVNSFLPLRPTTVFKGDRLFIEQTMPITHGRRDSTISFAVPNLHGSALPDYTPGKPSEPTCDYPGVLWRKSVNSLDCLDVYSAELPWSQHEMCGFVQDTSAPATKSVYKAQLLHTVTDIGKHGNTEFLKISTTSYLLTVSFNNRLTVSSAAISVVLSDPSNPVAVAIVSGVFYNVATKMTLVSFETEVQWPYQIAGPTITASWKAGSLGLPSNGVATLQPGLDGDCETVQDTPCSQSWLLTLDTSGSDCNLDGVLEFPTGNFICRDVSPLASCSFAASNNFSFVVAPTNLCPEAQPETVDASANTQINLVTFADYEHTAQQSVYQVGDMIYIALSISDPSVTIDQITVNTVQVQSDLVGSPDDVFVVTTPGTPGGAVLPGADLKFNITQELRKGAPESPLAPGTSALVKLGFKLSRASIPSLAIDTTNTDVSLTITIVCDILYHGNTKREIVVGTAQHYPITAHSIVNVVSDFETENEIENDGVAENIEEENGMFSFMSGVEQTKTNFVMLLFTLATLFVAML